MQVNLEFFKITKDSKKEDFAPEKKMVHVLVKLLVLSLIWMKRLQ